MRNHHPSPPLSITLCLSLSLSSAACALDDADDANDSPPVDGIDLAVPEGQIRPGPLPNTLVDGLASPRLLAADRTGIAFVSVDGDGFQVRLVRLLDGASVDLVRATQPAALVLTPTWVYWTEPDLKTLMRARRDGAVVEGAAKPELVPRILAADGDLVFVGTDEGVILVVAPDDAEPSKIASIGVPIVGLAFDPTWVFAAGADGSIWRVARDSASAMRVWQEQTGVGSLQLRDGSLYWFSETSVRRLDVDVVSDHPLPSTLLELSSTPSDLALDDSSLWLTLPAEGAIVRADRSGAAGQLLPVGATAPIEIVADHQFVAWLDEAAGALNTLAK